ncbi:hypothetical protein HDU96_009881 [Phlyctochytrium bullatum]|nr:hypothetical protein HDU96_009881 [Phlyctochytrium bullatum]
MDALVPTEEDDVDFVDKAKHLLHRCDVLLQSVESDLETELATLPTTGAGNTRAARNARKVAGGVSKFMSTVQAEKRFLAKLLEYPDTIRASHVKCSNLSFLEAVFSVMRDSGVHPNARFGAPEVFKTFKYVPAHPRTPGKTKQTVRVDVVLNGGKTWVKVKAGKLDSAAMELEEETSDEEDEEDDDDDEPEKPDPTTTPASAPAPKQDMIPIVRQAHDLLEASRQNPVHYKSPQVLWVFFRPDDSALPVAELRKVMEAIEQTGVLVMDVSEFRTFLEGLRGPPLRTVPSVVDSVGEAEEEGGTLRRGESGASLPDWNTVYTDTANLDVTTLITLVSDISNQFEQVPKEAFGNDALRLQEAQESVEPILNTLVPALEGKGLVITRSALQKYCEIAKIIAGPREKARTLYLFQDPFLPEVHAALEGFPDWQHHDAAVFSRIQPLKAKLEVVDDDPSDRFAAMVGSKPERGTLGGGGAGSAVSISKMHAVVFGTADRRQITTVTANGGLVRSLTKNGVLGLSLYLHEPRSLVETRLMRGIGKRKPVTTTVGETANGGI